MSEHLFKAAQQHIPGGVNSPVRAFKAVGGVPVFLDQARGAYVYATDGKKYVDYMGAWGPMVLGHAHPEVIAAVQKIAAKGLSFGAPTEIETQMADTLCRLVPSIEKVRLVNSGTEAAMSAIRLARGVTGRDKIVKFAGCYHGHADSLLAKAGSGALTLGVPDSAGVPAALAQHTITLDYNDPVQVRQIFETMGEQIAAVIVEPIAGNMSCIPGKAAFLHQLRASCDQYASILIFDEVMSGFRVALGGAQSLYDIQPDLTILGKVIGGGMPVGAFGGRAEIMNQIAPDGPVYQAGTLSGNPIAIQAGLITLKLVAKPDFFAELAQTTQALVTGLQSAAKAAGVSFSTNWAGGMFGLFFNQAEQISTFDQVKHGNHQQFKQFFHGMLAQGVYLAPSPYEAGFISTAHSNADISHTLEAAAKVFSRF